VVAMCVHSHLLTMLCFSFLVVRRPYDIGDRIAISTPDSVCSIDGSATWFVQTVGLFATTVRFAATNEVATLANGSLASSRVINAKRSPQANCYVYMKFSVHVPYSKVLIFRKAVEGFVKERPREWIGKFASQQVALWHPLTHVVASVCETLLP